MRIRKSTKSISIILAIIILIVSILNLIDNIFNENIQTKTKQIYYYSNSFKYSYKVNLIENKYVGQLGNIDNVNVYVTDLIDTTNFNMEYEYIGEKESTLNYNYQILGKIQVYYEKDGEDQKILEQEEILKEQKNKTTEASKLKINEVLSLDLKEKNQLLKEFKQAMGISVNAKYTLTLKVNVNTEIESKEIEAEFTPNIVINLGEKTTTISVDKNQGDTNYISKEYEEEEQKSIGIIISIIGIIISIVLLRFALKSKIQNITKNTYKRELNRYLKLCKDKIIEIDTPPESEEKTIVSIKNFGEIVKLSEELFKPILYYFNNENEIAYFYIISHSIIYQFVFKA